jgi:hypothetical protein
VRRAQCGRSSGRRGERVSPGPGQSPLTGRRQREPRGQERRGRVCCPARRRRYRRRRRDPGCRFSGHHRWLWPSGGGCGPSRRRRGARASRCGPAHRLDRSHAGQDGTDRPPAGGSRPSGKERRSGGSRRGLDQRGARHLAQHHGRVEPAHRRRHRVGAPGEVDAVVAGAPGPGAGPGAAQPRAARPHAGRPRAVRPRAALARVRASPSRFAR